MRRWQAQHVLDLGDGRARLKRIVPAPERDLVAALKKLLAAHYHVAWAIRVLSGSGFLIDWATMSRIIAALGGQEEFEARFGKPRWYESGMAGCSDFVGQLTDGRPLAIEVKAAQYSQGAVTIAQRTFLHAVNRYGGLGFVGSDSARIAEILSLKALPEDSGHGYLV